MKYHGLTHYSWWDIASWSSISTRYPHEHFVSTLWVLIRLPRSAYRGSRPATLVSVCLQY